MEVVYKFLVDFGVAWTACFVAVFIVTVVWYMTLSGTVSSDGKSVLITGCDSGFGNLLAHRLLSMRFHVFALCLDDASSAAAQLRSVGADILKCDVTSDSDVERSRAHVVKQLQKKGLTLWAVVNNAGIAQVNFVEWMPLSVFQRIHDVNAFGAVRILHAFLPFIRKSKGRVVNVASQAGRLCVPHFAAYCMSKHAVVALSDGLRMELKPFGVRVSIIQPGLYATKIVDFDGVGARSLELWNQTDKEIRDDYGQEFFSQTQKHMQEELEKMTRHDVNEVVDSMVHAVVSLKPRDFYDCHWVTTVSKMLITVLPIWMTDRIKLGIYTSGRPANAVN